MQTWRGRKRNRSGPDDEGALRAALEKQQPDPAAYRQVVSDVQRGTASMADIARFTGRPYGTVLLHRPAGILCATDLAPGLRATGEEAAGRAIEAGACVADLSSLHLLGLLADDDRLRIRSALPCLSTARAAVDDVLRRIPGRLIRSGYGSRPSPAPLNRSGMCVPRCDLCSGTAP